MATTGERKRFSPVDIPQRKPAVFIHIREASDNFILLGTVDKEVEPNPRDHRLSRQMVMNGYVGESVLSDLEGTLGAIAAFEDGLEVQRC